MSKQTETTPQEAHAEGRSLNLANVRLATGNLKTRIEVAVAKLNGDDKDADALVEAAERFIREVTLAAEGTNEGDELARAISHGWNAIRDTSSGDLDDDDEQEG